MDNTQSVPATPGKDPDAFRQDCLKATAISNQNKGERWFNRGLAGDV